MRTRHYSRMTFRPGDQVEYIGQPVFDLIIRTGDLGRVSRIEDDWVFAEWPESGEHSVPLRNARAVPTLPEPWWRSDPSAASAALAELVVEVSAGHLLHRLPVHVRARCGGCDEVMASVVDGTFALVHLTWSGRSELPPWPTVGASGRYEDYELALAEHARAH
jgi:hypothetical protein